LEVEPWYWTAIEDHTLLSRGHLGLDDLTWGRYNTAYDVAHQRDLIASARAEARRKRESKEKDRRG
jgi:hypothetical protein